METAKEKIMKALEEDYYEITAKEFFDDESNECITIGIEGEGEGIYLKKRNPEPIFKIGEGMSIAKLIEKLKEFKYPHDYTVCIAENGKDCFIYLCATKNHRYAQANGRVVVGD